MKVSVLVAQFVLNVYSLQVNVTGQSYTHICMFCFFCHSPLLLLVARERYQMNTGSYLVTHLISCGPALPCGCCSRDDGDEEEEGEGAGVG